MQGLSRMLLFHMILSFKMRPEDPIEEEAAVRSKARGPGLVDGDRQSWILSVLSWLGS